MSSKCVLVLPDPHAHPQHNNKRAEWAGNLAADLKPDLIINLGDQWDMPSLSSYEKGTKSFVGRSYQDDIESGLDFSDRFWTPVRKRKRKLPRRVFLVGNHEHRVHKAINMSPELEGGQFGISVNDFDLENYYDNVVDYDGGTPGIIEIDGIMYAHYFVSGLMGRSTAGVNPAATLINKNYKTSVCGHQHVVDWAVRTTPDGKQIHGLVAGVFQDYKSEWAGTINNKWWPGLVILHNVEDGQFTPQFVSMRMLKEEYGQ